MDLLCTCIIEKWVIRLVVQLAWLAGLLADLPQFSSQYNRLLMQIQAWCWGLAALALHHNFAHILSSWGCRVVRSLQKSIPHKIPFVKIQTQSCLGIEIKAV